MYLEMPFEVASRSETLPTSWHDAQARLLKSVGALVASKLTVGGKTLLASVCIADIRFLTGMNANMVRQISQLPE